MNDHDKPLHHDRRVAIASVRLAGSGGIAARPTWRWLVPLLSLLACSESATGEANVVQLQLINKAGRDIFIQRDEPGVRGFFTLTTAEGRTFLPSPSCQSCLCEPCRAGNCAVCGQSIAQVERIAPEGMAGFAWGGAAYVLVQNGCRLRSADLSCFERRSVPPGRITVTITYGYSFVTTTSGLPETLIGDPRTVQAVFGYPGEERVDISLR